MYTVLWKFLQKHLGEKMMRDTMIICHENILQNSMGKINRKWNNIHEYACIC
jgi:hypothetical protein